MSNRRNFNGVNVPIESASSADTHIANNITISNYNANDKDIEVIYGTKGDSSNAFGAKSDPNSVGVRDVNTIGSTTAPDANQTKIAVDEYLLTLYQSILLNQDKKLLANLVSKKTIVLTKQDLEEVVRRKVGKECEVIFEDPDATCCGMKAPFLKIESIRIYDDTTPSGIDFTVGYNKEYLELIGQYKLCTTFVLAN